MEFFMKLIKMKKLMQTKRMLLFILPVLVSLSACTALVNRAGEILEGNKVKVLEIFRTPGKKKEDKKRRIEVRLIRVNETGLEALEIEGALFPGFRLRAALPNEDGETAFSSLEFLSSSLDGWNEFSLELFGSGSFVVEGNTAVLKIAEAPERVEIREGRIRLNEKHFTGDGALSSLRSRRVRILALSEWMESQEEIPAFGNQAAFESFWKPWLFPELVSNKKKPLDWRLENDEFVWADSIHWNRSYTERVFPEELWEYRNSGALLRDWEEAAAWIFVEYAWDVIIASFNEVTLEKIQ
jgi:hypothetical protein